ncbi:MAG: suppressor of fused domain protein [Myxococcota bacterium]
MGESRRHKQLLEHVQATIGPVHGVVDCGPAFGVHVELFHVPPTEGKRFHVLTTAGVSDRAQAVPEGEENGCARVELLIGLDDSWPVDEKGFITETWPLRLLDVIGRFPHEQEAWLSLGHTIPNGQPPEPFFPEGPAGVLVLPPVALMPEVEWVEIDGEPVRFMALVPVYKDELEFKVQRGVDALLERFDKRDINEVFSKERPRVAGGIFDLL